jgi:hypothetical protein
LRQRIQEYARLQCRLIGCKEYVTTPALWNTETGEVEHLIGNAVSSGSESYPSRVEDMSDVASHHRHVLDEDYRRHQYLCSPRHARVEFVSIVRASRMVVQVRMTLAGRAADENVDRPDFITHASLGG